MKKLLFIISILFNVHCNSQVTNYELISILTKNELIDNFNILNQTIGNPKTIEEEIENEKYVSYVFNPSKEQEITFIEYKEKIIFCEFKFKKNEELLRIKLTLLKFRSISFKNAIGYIDCNNHNIIYILLENDKELIFTKEDNRLP
ncbi:hypothetical protein [Flavobacterium sp.]|uniref:hypothetical protein n=1 Tax=Flavobacterium sp. TaxID=239 RepID=UPI004048A1E4